MQDCKITVIKARRRTLSLSVKPDGTVCVKAPLTFSDDKIYGFVLSHERWINKRLKSIEDQGTVKPFSTDEIARLKSSAKQVIIPLAYKYAEIIGVKFNKITLKAQSTLWGSRSVKGNLNFNCLLMLAPSEVAEYVVIHELCHAKQMNHSRKFWQLVEKYCPDYRERKKWLTDNGSALLTRVKSK